MCKPRSEQSPKDWLRKNVLTVALASVVIPIAVFRIAMLFFEAPREQVMHCFQLNKEAKPYFPLIQLQPNMYNFSNINETLSPSIPAIYNNEQTNHYPARHGTFRMRSYSAYESRTTSTYRGTSISTHYRIEKLGKNLRWIQLND